MEQVICAQRHPFDSLISFTLTHYLNPQANQPQELYPHLDLQDYHKNLDAEIQLRKQMLDQEETPQKKGRGGNNVSENLKKAVLNLFQKNLPSTLYNQVIKRLIKPYGLKSQKQNLLLYFMFLQMLVRQHKLSPDLVQTIIQKLKLKIQKYIANSQTKLIQQDWKKQFHQKNIQEFRKFQSFNLDFTHPKSFKEVIEELKTLYLRKKNQHLKAEKKIRKVIKDHPILQDLFYELADNGFKDTGSMTEEQNE